MRAPSQTAPTALMSPHAGNDQRSVTESRGRHRPEEPDTTARGHSDRSRREGCGTEKVLGGSRNSGSGRYSLPRFSAELAGRVKNKQPLRLTPLPSNQRAEEGPT
jgi:hypothetical protein